MPKFRLRHAFVAVLLLVSMLSQGTWALASTTGGISGVAIDSSTGKGVADASVTAVSPSQSATVTTDAGGNFHFLTLSPDTYTISAAKSGYNTASATGITVFADQTHTLTLSMQPSLRTIANVVSTAAGNLVKPGTTSDVYSVNAATQQVLAGQGGGYNLNQAYSGIYSQPGVESYIGNNGWGEVFYIRGAGYDATGYEFDGVPVNRAFDNYNSNSLASLGQQELQVYTGGSPSSASSATLGGFINQVIKTGTYPGTGTLRGGIGAPGFYHALTAEAGGSNPNRTFSYYVGLQGYNAHYPQGTWANMSNIASNGLNQYGLSSGYEIANIVGALAGFGNPSSYTSPPDFGGWTGQFVNGPFQPCQTSGANAGEPIGYTAGSPGPFGGACLGYFPWNAPFLADEFERDSVVNLHFAIPHHSDSGRDDLQLLYDNSFQVNQSADSINDAGGLGFLNSLLQPLCTVSTAPCASSRWPAVCAEENFFGAGCASLNSPIAYIDTRMFAPGSFFGQQVTATTTVPYWFPNSNTNRALNTPGGLTTVGIEPTLRDAFNNNIGIVKGQYTKNIGSNAYARLFAYSFYSDWMIGGATTGNSCYINGALCSSGGIGIGGEEAGDYELSTHTRGAEFQFADQINAQNLLRLTANYTTASVIRFNNGSFRAGFSGSRTGISNISNGDPNNPICYSFTTGFQKSCFSSSSYGTPQSPTRGQAQSPCSTPALATTPACTSGATWLVTVPGGQGTFNKVRPVFTSASLEDEFKPNDKLDLNIGVRFENYQYNLADLNNPEFNFWFNETAQTSCYDPGTGLAQFTPLGLGQPTPPSAKSTNPLASCGVAPSGVEGLHPVGGTSLCGRFIQTSASGAGYTTTDCGPLLYTAKGPSQFTHSFWSPRIAGTYTISPEDVLRASFGLYTQPTPSAFEQYGDASGKRAASGDFGFFWGLGFHTPAHDNAVQYSGNYDFSWEHRFRGSDVTFKVSPFYRDTHNAVTNIVLGPNFISGINAVHQHSYGVEFQAQKGDPTRDGWSGTLSYTYTKALAHYDNLPNGTNTIDNMNNYIKAFNALTSAGGGSACYFTDPATGNVSGVACPANFSTNPNTVINPYFSMSVQPLMNRDGWYPTYPNEPPSDPNINPLGYTAIWPHQINAWVQYKHGRWAIAPNFTLSAGAYYGTPVDTFGIDPRSCPQNETAATTSAGTAVPGVAGTAAAGFCDFLLAGGSGFTNSSYLAIPNPYTGSFDQLGQYQEPWQLNIGALLRYDISPKVTANLTLANLVNWCYGGSNTPWSSAFKPNQWVCGYGGNSFNYVGPLQGQPGFGGGFFYGTSPGSASNGSPTYPTAFNYPFSPYTSAQPFQAYLEVQVKI